MNTRSVSYLFGKLSFTFETEVKDGPALAAGLARKCSARAFFVEGFVSSETAAGSAE